MTKEDNIKKSTYELKILEKHNMRFSEVESEVRIRCRKDMCWDFNVYSLSKFLCRINCRPQHQYPKPQYPQQQYPQLQYPQHQYPQPNNLNTNTLNTNTLNTNTLNNNTLNTNTCNTDVLVVAFALMISQSYDSLYLPLS